MSCDAQHTKVQRRNLIGEFLASRCSEQKDGDSPCRYAKSQTFDFDSVSHKASFYCRHRCALDRLTVSMSHGRQPPLASERRPTQPAAFRWLNALVKQVSHLMSCSFSEAST